MVVGARAGEWTGYSLGSGTWPRRWRSTSFWSTLSGPDVPKARMAL